jgi:hypothetical protein
MHLQAPIREVIEIDILAAKILGGLRSYARVKLLANVTQRASR